MMRKGVAFTWSSMVIAVLLHACHPRPDAGQLANVQRMIAANDSLRKLCMDLDTAAIGDAVRHFEIQKPLIEKRFVDTLDTEEAALLGNHYRVMHTLSAAALTEREELLQHMDSTAERLHRLRYDLAAALLPPSSASAHLVHENAAQSADRKRTEQLQNAVATITAQAERHHARVDTLLGIKTKRP